jgi:hypothetical protein
VHSGVGKCPTQKVSIKCFGERRIKENTELCTGGENSEDPALFLLGLSYFRSCPAVNHPARGCGNLESY